MHDDGISPSFFDNQQQQPDWDHTYDPLYRLVTATGRESAIDDQDPVPSWVTSGSGFGPTPPPSGTAARGYVQQIAYDPVGNLSSVQHFVPGQSSASWTRSYSYPADSNRLSSDTLGGVTSSYGYDAAGNMSSMPHLPGSGGTAGLQWSWANQLAQTYSSSSAAARYAYGGDGQRVVKRFGSLSGSVLTPSKVTVYLPGGFEITGSFSGGALQVELQSLAVMDDRTCVARFEVKAVDGGVATGESAVLRYQVGNHLGSACLEISEAGQVLTREEYYAYGGTAYAFAASGAAGFSVKRYRYAGKECDSENGLYYFGARYFAAWLGRWTAGDPVFAAGRSAYEYCHSNPTTKVDPDGRWPRDNHEELAVRNPEAFAAQGRIGAPAALTAIGIAVSAVGVGYAFAAFGPAAGAVALADEAFGHATGIPISPSSAVRIARNPIKAVEQTVEAARGVAAAVRSAGSGVHVAEKIAVAGDSAGAAARRAPGGAESGLRAGLPKAGGDIHSGDQVASPLKGGRRQLPSGTPGTLVPNRLLPHEASFAQEIVDFQGGTFVGAVEKSLPGIDGHLSGIPVSLKETAGGLGAVLRHTSKAEASALSAGVSGVELFIKAPNVRATQLLDFARGGPLSQIPGQGTISGISVFTQDGVVRIIGAQIARGAQ